MMSEKIILTVLQEEIIKDFLVGTKKTHVLNQHVTGWNDEENKALNSLSIDQMARILYEPNSYVVESPKFEVGDFVARHNGKGFSNGKKILTVKKVKPNGAIHFKETDSWLHGESIRHATKEEIIFAELGREVGEFVDNDIVFGHDGSVYEIDRKSPGRTSKGMYERGELKGFYPANSFIKLP